MGSTYAVAIQKGGVGKTTTAINLAASLALSGNETLLVDIDPQSNSSSGLGVAPGSLEQSVYDLLMDGTPAADLIQPTAVDSLHLLPANDDLAGAEVELVAIEEREQRLLRAIAPLQERYDYIIIDCPPSLGLLTLNALVAADGVITPMQCEYFALEGITKIVSTVEKVRAAWNPKLAITGILLTMFDSRVTICQQVAGEIRNHFADRVFETVIPRNVRLSECPSFGKPIALYDPRSKGSEAYFALAREIHLRTRAAQNRTNGEVKPAAQSK